MNTKRFFQTVTAATIGISSFAGLSSSASAVTLFANQAEDAISLKNSNAFQGPGFSAPGENEVGSQRSGNSDPTNNRAARTFVEFNLTSGMIAEAQAALGVSQRLQLSFDVDAIFNGTGKLEGLDVRYFGIAGGDRSANTLWNSAPLEIAQNVVYANSSTGIKTATFSNAKVISDIAAASAGQVIAFGLVTDLGVDNSVIVGNNASRQVYILNEATSSYSLQVGPKLLLVTPTTIAQTAGNTLGGFPAVNMINNSGFALAPTVANFTTASYVDGGNTTSWVTASTGSPTYFSNVNNPAPQFTMSLGSKFDLTDLLIWGYSATNSNGASDFLVEFSLDGGTSYYDSEFVQTSFPIGSSNAVLTFGDVFSANFIRMTMLGNEKSRGLTGLAGGDRVGLGEIKFLAVAPIPEPATMGLMLAGAMGLMARRRRIA